MQTGSPSKGVAERRDADAIVERARRRRGRLRNRPHDAGEDPPRFLGAKRDASERGGEKELNENLKPLFRYLDRQVGRPWNKVFSEIAANLRPTNTVQKHVLDHLWMMVSIGPIAKRWWGVPEFYVDPANGLLRRNPRNWRFRPKRRPAAQPVERIRVAPLLEHRKVDGIWYEVRLTALPEPIYRSVRRNVRSQNVGVGGRVTDAQSEVIVRQLVTPSVRDVVTGLVVKAGPEIDDERAWAEYRKAHRERLYATAKRQLSREELRKGGLGNDPV